MINNLIRNNRQINCFISHPWDKGFHDSAIRISKALKEKRINTWIDEDNIKPGDDIQSIIFNAINNECQILLLLLSKSTLTSKSCMQELKFALTANIGIIPLLFEKCKLPIIIKRFLYVDFSQPAYFDAAINLLIPGIDKLARIAFAIDDLNNLNCQVRLQAIKYLYKLPIPRLVNIIKKHIKKEKNNEVLYWCTILLGNLGSIPNKEGKEAINILLKLKKKTQNVRIIQGINDAMNILNKNNIILGGQDELC